MPRLHQRQAAESILLSVCPSIHPAGRCQSVSPNSRDAITLLGKISIKLASCHKY